MDPATTTRIMGPHSAYELLQGGHAAEAGRMARDALREGQDETVWWPVLALSLAARQRHGEARDLFARLCARQPGVPEHAINLGNACLACGDGTGARLAFDVAGRAGAEGVAYWLGHGLAALACRQFAIAESSLRRAYRVQPDAPDVALAWAQCLCELERFDEAARCMRRVEPAALSPSQRAGAAWLLARCGLEADAETLFRACIAAGPVSCETRLQYALLLERLNRIDEAAAQIAEVDRAAIPPAPMHALAASRVMRRTGRCSEALALLGHALKQPMDDELVAQLQFERAKLHDMGDEPAPAMDALAQAHAAARRAFLARQPDACTTRLLGWLDQRLHAPAPLSWQRAITDGCPPDPVFLVGFPRSGTTLLQHILAGHPALRAMEEKPALEDVIATLRQGSAGTDDLIARLDALLPSQLAKLRAEYWQGVAHHVQECDGRLLDKYPLSFTRVGYLARLFPRSHTLFLLRHPCDVVLSCHMQAFGLNGGALAFESLASTARTYARLMEYWEEQRPRAACAVRTLRYEDLVADMRGTLRGALDFLGLDWHAGLESFHRRAAAQTGRIRTPSYAQVIHPINAGAVGRWHRYRAYFEGEALDALAPWVARYGYALE